MKAVIFLFLFIMTNADAYMISTGTHVPYFNKAQSSISGSTKKFEINPYIGIGTQFYMAGEQYFVPEIGYSYYLENPKGSRTEVIFFHYNFSYVFTSELLFRYGLTTHWYRIVGKGGNTSLNNGTSTTSFPNPDKTVTSYFTTLNFGTEYFILQKAYGIRFDLNMMSFKDTENKALNYLLTVNIY
jgi:hypothetical protein